MPTTVTKTVKSAGGDYSSVSAWEAGQQGSLTALDEIHEAQCYSFSDTTQVTLAGWTTDATRYPRVYADVSARPSPSGIWDATKFVMTNTSTSPTITGAFKDWHFDWIQFDIVGDATHGTQAFLTTTSDGFIATKCIIRFTGTLSATLNEPIGFSCESGAGSNIAVNCIAYDFKRNNGDGKAFSVGTGSTLYLYNCTAYGCANGFFRRSAGNPIAKNSLAQACTDGFVGVFGAGTTNNCSDIAADAPGSNPVTGTVTFVNTAGKNFHLDSTDTVAMNAGTSLAADGVYAFSDDIDGDTRPQGAQWDIGADEFVASGPASTDTLMPQIWM